MSLRNLVEGQCGEGNALLKLTQHISKDKAHVDDGIHWRSSTSGYASSSFDDFVEEFLHEHELPSAAPAPQTFRMDALFQEMREIESMRAKAPPLCGPGVATLTSEADKWAEEYLASEMYIQDSVPLDDWSKEYLEQTCTLNSPDLITDTDTKWEQEFNKEDSATVNVSTGTQDDADLAKTANELLGTIDDPKFSNTEFFKFIRKLADGKKESAGENWAEEFLSSNSGKTEEKAFSDSWSTEFLASSTGRDPMLAANEFSSPNLDMKVDSGTMTTEGRKQFWANLQEEWEKLASGDGGDPHPWLTEFDSVDTEPYKTYSFERENPMRDHPDPLEEGKKCRKEGNLPSAIHLFEAAAQRDANCHEAWYLLGITHAENEQDPSAISALRMAADIDPLHAETWMALATSYTNENMQTLACNSLKEWIRSSSEYAFLVRTSPENSPSPIHSSLAPRELIEEVQDLYISAANLRAVDNMDPDIQIGLGVLFNLTGDYDKAIDCFRAAVAARPKDAVIWNKIGATLANENKPVEAINAYRNALEIMPGFIRCRYNLGIACLNIGAKREAAEHFLEALNMQAAGTVLDSSKTSHAMSDCIWNTLKDALLSLGMKDLADSCFRRDLDRLNDELNSQPK